MTSWIFKKTAPLFKMDKFKTSQFYFNQLIQKSRIFVEELNTVKQDIQQKIQNKNI